VVRAFLNKEQVMSDEIETNDDPYAEYDEFGGDVGLGDEDKHYGKSNTQEWFKGQHQRTYLGHFVYFHPVDVSAVLRYRAKAKKEGKTLDREQIQKIAQAALKKRAEELEKSVDALDKVDQLDLSQVRFKHITAHYIEEGPVKGYVTSRLGKDGADADKAWSTLPAPRDYFSTCLLIYPTDQEGNIDKDAVAREWRVLPWRFSNKIYDRIWSVNKGLKSNDLSIANQDLRLKCSNGEFQNWEIDSAGKALFRRSPKFERKVLERALPLYEKLNPFRVLATADLKVKLGMDGGGGEDISDDDMDDLIANV